MAEENRKAKNNWLYWIIGILAVLVIIIFFTRKDEANQHITAEAASDSTTIESKINNNWTGVDPNIPVANYDEVRDSDLQVRANKDYAVYSLNEAVLFEPGKYVIAKSGSSKLATIAASAKKRFVAGSFIIYGYTDSVGTKDANKDLALNRANAVKAWLVEFEKISPDQVTVNSEGEKGPLFSNSSEQGRQKNRRVDIVVRKK